MSAPGLESGLKILQYISCNEEAGFNQIKNELDLSPASLNRYLKILVEQNFIEKTDSQQYKLGKMIYNISMEYKSLDNIVSTIQPVLENISIALNATSLFIYYKEGKMICAAKKISPEGLNMQEINEERTDYIIHPWGFLLLASLDEEKRKLYIKNSNVYERFKKEIPDNKTLDMYIKDARKNGYFDDLGKILKSIRRIAVPVYINKTLIGSIGIGMLESNLNENKKADIIKFLFKKAKEVNEALSDKD